MATRRPTGHTSIYYYWVVWSNILNSKARSFAVGILSFQAVLSDVIKEMMWF